MRLEIDESQAEVVRRIFTMASKGCSLKKIARVFNAERIAPPLQTAKTQDATECPTAIHTMLGRELYIGRVIWNRSRFVKRLGTNKRNRRPRPRKEWKVIERSELRIANDELWKSVRYRPVWTKEVYGRQNRDGLLNRTASSQYP